MKKCTLLLIGALLVLMTLCLGGCGSSNTETSNSEETTNETQNSSDSDTEVNKTESMSTLTIGDTGEINGIAYTLNSAQLMDKGIVDDEHFNPPEGRKALLLNMTVTNNSDEGYDSVLGEYWVMAKNTECNHNNIGQDDDLALGGPVSGEMAPGENETGTLSFFVPADADKYELFCSPELAFDKDETKAVEFVITPNQIQ